MLPPGGWPDSFGPNHNMAFSHPYRKPQRKETTLPPYEPPSPTNPMSFYTPVPTTSAIAQIEPRRFNSPRVGIGTPERRRSLLMDYLFTPARNLSGDLATLSGDSMRRVVTTIMEGYSNAGISMLGGPMHAAPETIASPISPSAPLPPSYSASVKPMLLWLDGGGTKVVVENHFLEELMHKLGWDLKFTTSQPGRIAGGEYIIPPKDCFDWVASCGCGTIIAFGIACGMRVKEIRTKFIGMTRALRTGSETELHNLLLSMIPNTKQSMEFAGTRVRDSPLLVNVWVPAETDVAKNPGICVLKGEPLEARLLPLVMREVAKEWNGALEFLDSTVSFLQDVCPIFDDCSFLLSLGSGEVPRNAPQQSWWDWVWGVNAPSPHPPLPPCLPHKRNHIIPPEAYSTPARYIRLSPRLVTRSESGAIQKPDDWAIDVTEILTMTSAFALKEETRQALDRINDMLKWRDIAEAIVPLACPPTNPRSISGIPGPVNSPLHDPLNAPEFSDLVVKSLWISVSLVLMFLVLSRLPVVGPALSTL